MKRARVVLAGSVLCAAAVAAISWTLAARLFPRARHGEQVTAGKGADLEAARSVSAAAEDDVAGLAGEIEKGPGSRLRVRLVPLHADRAREQFDAAALARHFGLGAGEPFVCELAATGGGLVQHGALRSIAVRDERGLALSVLSTAPQSTPNEPSDPLAVLLAPPDDALGAGRSVSVILWGRAPGDGARLTGLAAGDVQLAPARMTARELDTALARIDAPPRARSEGGR